MDKIIVNGDEYKVVNGYPMVNLMFLEEDNISNLEEWDVEEWKNSLEPGKAALALKNLDDPSKCKDIISGDIKGYRSLEEEIEDREELFIIIKKEA